MYLRIIYFLVKNTFVAIKIEFAKRGYRFQKNNCVRSNKLFTKPTNENDKL